MASHQTRNLVRALVGTALCAALIACAAAPVPDNLPAVAFRQPGLYRMEIALFIFYSGLLLITPAISGLINGRLPIEISTRGARFAEEADGAADAGDAAIEKLEATTNDLALALADTQTEIERLREMTTGDSTQRGVDSNR